MQINVKKKNSNVGVLQIICTSLLQAYVCVCVAYMDIYIYTHYIYVFSDISDFSMLPGSLRSFLGRMCPVSRLH